MENTVLSPRLLATGDFEQELASTRRVIERVPQEHLAWKPHPKSFSIGELAQHLANLPFWPAQIACHDSFDISALPDRISTPLATVEEILERFDANAERLLSAIGSMPDEALSRPYTLRNGSQVMSTMPKADALRRMGMSHLIHHRGQLTVYLRLLDVPVPGLYGPSADEKAGHTSE